MDIHAVIFDLDGTLVNSLGDIADAANRMLTSCGFAPHPEDAYRYFVGDGVVMLVKRALPANARDERTVRSCVEIFRTEYGSRWNNKTRLYEGVPEMLDRVASLGLPMGILSNKPHAWTRAMVTELLPRWQFSHVLGQREGMPQKPDPTAALEIAVAMQIPPEAVLYVGDMPVDMEMGRSAGMCSVGVLWGFRDREELQGAGASVIVEQPTEVAHLLEKTGTPARSRK